MDNETLETTDTSLTISRIFRATPEELWQLWTNPKKINEWHRPNMTDFITTSEVDTKVGGLFKISMKRAGNVDTAFGTFKELSPPHKLVYSWRWENDPTNEVSEVTVIFWPVSGGTKLTLVHERLSNPDSVKAHGEGWLGCMENINQLIQ